MTSISERPYLYSFSNNEIRYKLVVTDPEAEGCAVEFEIYTLAVTATGAGSLLHSFTIYPNAEGLIYCHIAPYLKSMVTPQLPEADGDQVQPVSSQVVKYYIRYRQVTTEEPDPAWSTDIDNTIYVLMGGIEQMKFRRNNFFVNYLADNKPFLTWQPSGRYVFAQQPIWLTFLLLESTTSLSITTLTKFTDGTSNTTNFGYDLTDNLNVLFFIKAGATALGLDAIDTAKTIWYYDITVKNGSDVVLANAYRFYIDYNQHYDWRGFLYSNSISGWDAVKVTGEEVRVLDVTGQEIEQVVFSDVYTTKTPTPQYGQANIVKRDMYKGDLGYTDNPFEQEAWAELLMSRNIYELQDERWIKVLGLKKSMDLTSTAASKWGFAVEWGYGYSDTVFTPKAINMGEGSAV